MEIIQNTIDFYIKEKTAVAIGKFDGFHKGHQKLLEMLRRQKEKGLKSVVFTFVPSPAVFFSKGEVKELSTIDEKRHIFENSGVDYLIEYPFCQEIADMEPQIFIKEVLVNRLQAKCIVAGEDVSYGRNGSGDYKLLNRNALEYGYEVNIIDKVYYNGKEVSSTYVREEVKNGNMALVADLLGAPYHISGEIIHGQSFGHTIGMPTVNILPPKDKLLPPNGVYYSYVYIHSKQKEFQKNFQKESPNNLSYTDKRLPSITNIGTKPTVDHNCVIGVETYIYDFNANVYGEDLEVYLLERKRAEMRFDGIAALKVQMASDIEAGRIYHDRYFQRL